MTRQACFWKAIPLALALAFAMFALPIAMPQQAYAGPIDFGVNSFTFSNAEDSNAQFFTKGDSVDISSATSSDESVAIVERFERGMLFVEPVGEGTATITVIGTDASTTTIEIIVLKEYFDKRLEEVSYVTSYWYGNRKLEVDSQPGAKCTLKIGTETHSFTMGAKGEATVKLNKVYKVGTAFSCVFTKGNYRSSFKGKIFSGTGFDIVKATKKTVKVHCYQLHKGDVVKLTYKGKTYTKKITKNQAYAKVKFTPKNKVKKNAKLKVIIKNKFKQKLYSDSFALKKWFYERPEGDPRGEYV